MGSAAGSNAISRKVHPLDQSHSCSAAAHSISHVWPSFCRKCKPDFHSNENQIKLFKNFTEHRLYQNIKLKKHKLSQLYYLVIPQSPYKKDPE